MRSPQHETNLQPQSHHSQAETENLQPDVLPPVNPLLAQVGRVPNSKTHAAMLQRSPANPQAILQLQRQHGNRYINRVLQQSQPSRSMPIQAKLTLGAMGDKYEQEADLVAKQVVNQINVPAPQSSIQSQPIQREEMPEEDDELMMMKPVAGTIQRQEMLEEDDELMMKSESVSVQRMEIPEEDDEAQMKPMVQRLKSEDSGAIAPDLETSIQQARGSGKSLPDNIRQRMEQAFGANFSGVKVHTDTTSDRLNQSIQAKAFTTEHDIFFRQGEYNPESRGGQELIAHELTHVMQQNNTLIQRKPGKSTSGTKPLLNVEPETTFYDDEYFDDDYEEEDEDIDEEAKEYLYSRDDVSDTKENGASGNDLLKKDTQNQILNRLKKWYDNNFNFLTKLELFPPRSDLSYEILKLTNQLPDLIAQETPLSDEKISNARWIYSETIDWVDERMAEPVSDSDKCQKLWDDINEKLIKSEKKIFLTKSEELGLKQSEYQKELKKLKLPFTMGKKIELERLSQNVTQLSKDITKAISQYSSGGSGKLEIIENQKVKVTNLRERVKNMVKTNKVEAAFTHKNGIIHKSAEDAAPQQWRQDFRDALEAGPAVAQGAQGIKKYQGKEYDYELKILGSGGKGDARMFGIAYQGTKHFIKYDHH